MSTNFEGFWTVNVASKPSRARQEAVNEFRFLTGAAR